MYGFENAKDALNLNSIFAKIASSCHADIAESKVFNSVPLLEHSSLNKEFKYVDELQKLFSSGERIPLSHYDDIRVLLNKLEPEGSYLTIEECLQFKNFLEIITDLKSDFKKYKESCSLSFALLEQFESCKNLLNQLQFTFDPSGQIFDNATSELKAIRKSIRKLQGEIHSKLDSIRKKQQEHLQEDYITLSEGRLVLPVREFSANKIQGIIHGESASGATKYVEPMAVVNLNNEIQESYLAEKREIVKILKRISRQIKNEQLNLESNLQILVQFDVYCAKATYGNSIRGLLPGLKDDFSWKILRGFHPVLKERIADSAIPLSIELGDEKRILIISGPNAGGKTVALKTVGLLQLMVQCAIPVPVDEGSSFPVCKKMFVQIGDKQSLENDLSTFSSHIKGLKEITDNIAEESLVIIDEIGIGTEPSGGAALAIAILEHLNREDIVTLVSTHQNQLKMFASETSGIVNAAMQYDIDSMQPLFILETGIPGGSFTFDICKRYGLDENLVMRAKNLEGNVNQNIEKLLNDITKKSAYYKEMSGKLSTRESELNALVTLYEQKVTDFKRNQKKLEKEAKEKAAEIIDSANRTIEKTIREIRETEAEKNKVKSLRRDLDGLKKQMQQQQTEDKKEKTVKTDPSQLKEGLRARSDKFNVTGIISKIYKNKKMVELDRDGIKVTVSWDDLVLLEKDKKKSREESFAPVAPGGVSDNEVDLRGMDVEDALTQLDAYLDSAVHSDWNEVTIIHGKGTGTLRKAVQQYLSTYKPAKNYRTGRHGEGDTGVTIVTLK